MALNFRFLAHLRVGDAVDIESWVEAWNEKTLTVKHQAMRAGELVAESTEVRAWVVGDAAAPTGFTVTQVPDAVKQRFA